MSAGRFATSISCMDGRVQPVISSWVRQNYQVDFVDTITAPGVDKRIAEETDLKPLIDMAKISINAHKSRLIVVSGHYQCAGNPVSDEEHADHIKKSVDVIRSWEGTYDLPDDGPNDAAHDSNRIKVVGLWVGDTWSATRIA